MSPESQLQAGALHAKWAGWEELPVMSLAGIPAEEVEVEMGMFNSGVGLEWYHPLKSHQSQRTTAPEEGVWRGATPAMSRVLRGPSNGNAAQQRAH